ncbi:hypothetical protein [Brevibacillus laterosporus]|uniref:hypothetical protein n=1 Tax=Brevibacillus laterosporus TaxID=1465 RepID=UPI0003B22612|nr:hypothetical protein [Brevibacillus laterosporus]ERM18244.1 hypothetical protein P615_18020 [Brevibacillus laterosporus PE36]
MLSNHIPLLAAHLFTSGMKEMMDRLNESCITLKIYGPNDSLVDIKPKKPRVDLEVQTHPVVCTFSSTFSSDLCPEFPNALQFVSTSSFPECVNKWLPFSMILDNF